MNSPYCVSVVIPTYQRCTSLQRTLRALAAQTVPPTEYEVVVSIDGSTDGTRGMVDQFQAQYELRALWQSNQGRAAACNAGIRASRGELVLIMDDDIEPAPECLAAHLRAHFAGCRTGVMGAVPVTLPPGSSPVVRYVAANFRRHLDKLAQPGYQLQLRDFSTQNFSAPREALLAVGAFDDRLFKIYGNEDLEMSVRLRAAGIELVYDPRALAHQHYTKDFPTLARDTIAKGRTAILFASKHPQILPALQLSTYRRCSRKWRVVRAGLLSSSKVWPGLPQIFIVFVRLLEKLRPSGSASYYTLALDYFYWLGATAQAEESLDAPVGRSGVAML